MVRASVAYKDPGSRFATVVCWRAKKREARWGAWRRLRKMDARRLDMKSDHADQFNPGAISAGRQATMRSSIVGSRADLHMHMIARLR